MATTVPDGLIVSGAFKATGTVTLPSSCITNANVTAGTGISATKCEQQHVRGLAQARGSAAAAERRVVHRARAAGTLVEVKAGVTVAAVGDSTVTVDVEKNDTSVLSSTMTIDNGNTAYSVVETATINPASDDYVDGDVFEVVVTVSAGTGTLPQGLFVELVFREGPGV